MYALQRLLHAEIAARGIDWLKIGGEWTPGEVPWYWHWEDGPLAAAQALLGLPFVCGPNVLFERSARPCQHWYERAICRASSCRLIYTESLWYRDLVNQHRPPASPAPIVLWSYPIDPQPGEPLPAEVDVLVFAKSGYRENLARTIQRRHTVRVIRYGAYQRADLYDLARRARCCVYCSDDDRGPLALAEILLAGCPAIGVRRGAPWIEPETGVQIDSLDGQAILSAVPRAMALDRREVRAAALERFDPARTVQTIIASLEAAAAA